MNKLDDKVIVDRETLQYLLDWTSSALGNTDISTLSAHHYGEGEKHVAAAERSLAADLTGWAAVPVKPSRAMIQAGMDGYNSKVFGSDGIAAAYPAMLEATLAKHGENV